MKLDVITPEGRSTTTGRADDPGRHRHDPRGLRHRRRGCPQGLGACRDVVDGGWGAGGNVIHYKELVETLASSGPSGKPRRPDLEAPAGRTASRRPAIRNGSLSTMTTSTRDDARLCDPPLPRAGVGDTSFADVLAASGAPPGSVYHHFPGGKKQLVQEAIESAGGCVAANFERSEDGPAEMVDRFARFYISELERTDFREGCPDGRRGRRSQGRGRRPRRQRLQPDPRSPSPIPHRGRGEETGQLPRHPAISAIEGAIILSRTENQPNPQPDPPGTPRYLRRRAPLSHIRSRRQKWP